MRRRTEHYYLFGPFRLDPEEYRLQKDGLVVPLTPKNLAMLLMLVRSNGNLVEKDQLIQELWPDTFVEESNLTFNISVIRKALGDTVQTPRYIETVPKRGYRFLPSVEEVRTESQIKSIAVLPFVNMSGQEAVDYLADGIHEALISELAHISSLRVISRTSSMQYKSGKQSLAAFARSLQLDFAIEGSVLVEGSRVRINVRLIDAVNDAQLWAQSYDRSLRDVLSVQAEVAGSIVQRIELKLTPAQETRLRDIRSIDPEAHAAYLKGRYYWHQFFTEAGMKTAIEYFREAIELQPNYAEAWAYLSACFAAMAVQSMLPPAQAEAEGQPAAKRALELAPLSAEAHTIVAAYYLFFDWNWLGAERAIRKAIELSPSCEAHGLFAHYALARGWCEEAIYWQRRALDLDPMSATMNTDLVWAYLLSRDYARAVELGASAVSMKFSYPLTHLYLGQAYLCIGEYEKGIKEIEKTVSTGEESSGNFIAMLGYAYGVARKKTAVREMFRRMEALSARRYVASYDWAVLHAGSGETDSAIRRLTQAVDEREPRVIWLKVEPALESIRTDRRVQGLLHRLGLD